MKRFIEIDLARSIAIILMIVYHTAFDLDYFYNWNLDVTFGWWLLLQRFTASLFLFLVGVSAAITYQKNEKTWADHANRFMTIGIAALAITFATYVADPETYVRFGILHLIATSALLLPLVSRLKEGAIILGALLIALQPIVSQQHTTLAGLMLLGFALEGFRTVDYFPIIPWLGVIFIGYGVGYFWYVRRKLRVTRSENQELLAAHISILRVLAWPGRYALWIYLGHQPIILYVLWVLYSA